MGLEQTISQMPKKRLNLFKNIVSVLVIITVLYGALVLMQLSNPLNFFKTDAFIYICLILLSLSIAWKILNGGKVNFPNDVKKQRKPTNKQSKPKQTQSHKRTYQSNPSGSWECPKCKTFVIEHKCPKCGYRWVDER